MVLNMGHDDNGGTHLTHRARRSYVPCEVCSPIIIAYARDSFWGLGSRPAALVAEGSRPTALTSRLRVSVLSLVPCNTCLHAGECHRASKGDSEARPPMTLCPRFRFDLSDGAAASPRRVKAGKECQSVIEEGLEPCETDARSTGTAQRKLAAVPLWTRPHTLTTDDRRDG